MFENIKSKGFFIPDQLPGRAFLAAVAFGSTLLSSNKALTTLARLLWRLSGMGLAFQVWKEQRTCKGVIELNFFLSMVVLAVVPTAPFWWCFQV